MRLDYAIQRIRCQSAGWCMKLKKAQFESRLLQQGAPIHFPSKQKRLPLLRTAFLQNISGYLFYKYFSA
jgi:hypothetical protein